MCGIAGFFNIGTCPHPSPACETILRAMNGALRHRGPDENGFYVEAEPGIYAFHRLDWLKESYVLELLDRHREGSVDNTNRIWSVLTLAILAAKGCF